VSRRKLPRISENDTHRNRGGRRKRTQIGRLTQVSRHPQKAFHRSEEGASKQTKTFGKKPTSRSDRGKKSPTVICQKLSHSGSPQRMPGPKAGPNRGREKETTVGGEKHGAEIGKKKEGRYRARSIFLLKKKGRERRELSSRPQGPYLPGPQQGRGETGAAGGGGRSRQQTVSLIVQRTRTDAMRGRPQ